MLKRGLLFPCLRCGAIVDFLSALRAARGQEMIRPGDGCTNVTCTSRFRAHRHQSRQLERLELIGEGSRNLMEPPATATDHSWLILSDVDALAAALHALDLVSH